MKKSVEVEINNFIKRGSWEKVSREKAKSESRKIIPCKWVFKIKYELDNTVRYKTSLCVNRFHQVSYGTIFTGSKYINNFNITTHNVTHGRSRMDMQDVQRRGSIPKR